MVLLLAAASLPGSALFALQHIDVEGTRALTPEEVRAASGLAVGSRSIFLIDAQDVTRRLLAHPRIASARLRARPPHTLVIRVQERVPVAAVPAARGYAAVDGSGVVVTVTAERPVPALPLVSERGRTLPWVAPGQRVPSAAVRTGLALLAQLPPALRAETAHLQVTALQEVFLYVRDGLEIHAGPVRGLRQRLAAAPEILQTLRAQGTPLEYVDLSLPDQVIIKPRVAP